jgi:hypothetical protein
MRSPRSFILLLLIVAILSTGAPQANAWASARQGRLPHLTWNGFGIHWSWRVTESGQCRMRVEVFIGNIGNAPAGEFWAAIFYADQLAVKKRIPGLAVDEVVSIGGAVSVDPGHYDTLTIIDWHNLVPESDEENDDLDGEDCAFP